MANRLDKEQTAWATVMTEKKDDPGSRHLKKAGFSLIAWDRGSNHTIYFKVGKKGRAKDPQEVTEQLELMDRWKKGRDRKTTIYPSSFKNAVLRWPKTKTRHGNR